MPLPKLLRPQDFLPRRQFQQEQHGAARQVVLQLPVSSHFIFSLSIFLLSAFPSHTKYPSALFFFARPTEDSWADVGSMRVCPIRIGPLSNWSRIRVGRRVEAGGRRREEATSIHWRFNEKQQRNCSAQRAEFPYSVLALAVKPACRSLRSMLNSGCNLFAVVYPTSS